MDAARSRTPTPFTDEERDRLQSVGQEIYADQLALEAALNEAMARAARLGARLAEAPRLTNLAPVYGQGVVARVARVLPLLADARGEAAVAHQGLAKMQRELGVTLFWPFDDGQMTPFSTPVKKPEDPSGAAEVVPITAGPGRAAA